MLCFKRGQLSESGSHVLGNSYQASCVGVARWVALASIGQVPRHERKLLWEGPD